MADEPTNNSPPRTRRSSFAGQTFAELFGTGRPSVSRNPAENGNSPPSQYSGPITTAAAQAQRRRLSLTTLGLGNGNGPPPSVNPYRGRQDSLASTNGGSIDECAVEDEQGSKDSSTPATPFARRVSFGARAMMDIRNGGQQSPNQQNGRSPPAYTSTANRNSRGGGGGGGGGSDGNSRVPSAGTISAREAKGRASGEGFNWSENLRTRAERSSNAGLTGNPSPPSFPTHQRAKSVAVMEPPVREAPREQKRPDHFQERILKGDFYMD